MWCTSLKSLIYKGIEMLDPSLDLGRLYHSTFLKPKVIGYLNQPNGINQDLKGRRRFVHSDIKPLGWEQ